MPSVRLVPLIIVLGAAGCGFLAGRHSDWLAVLLLGGAALAAGLHNWRWSLLGLLLYFPFSGVAEQVAPSASSYEVLAKDFLFVLPCYLGFFVGMISSRNSGSRPRWPPSSLLLPLSLAVFWTLIEVLNPNLPSRLVGLIGLKVWLLYVPFAWIAYSAVAKPETLVRPLKIVLAAGWIPALLGIVQALFLDSGHTDPMTFLYSRGLQLLQPNQGGEPLGGGFYFIRIRSTLPFVTQYYVLMATMFLLSWVLLGDGRPGSRGAERRGLFSIFSCILFLLATLLSGENGAVLLIPPLLPLLYLLNGKKMWGIGTMIVVGGVAWALLAAGHNPYAKLLSTASSTGTRELSESLSREQVYAWSSPWVGVGVGGDTSTAFRYGGLAGTAYVSTESWLSRLRDELGIPGMVLWLAVMLAALLHIWRSMEH